MAGDTGSQSPLLKPSGYILPQAPHGSLGTKQSHVLILRKPVGRDGERPRVLLSRYPLTVPMVTNRQRNPGEVGNGVGVSPEAGDRPGWLGATLCSHTARGSACSWALCLLLSSAARIN